MVKDKKASALKRIDSLDWANLNFADFEFLLKAFDTMKKVAIALGDDEGADIPSVCAMFEDRMDDIKWP